MGRDGGGYVMSDFASRGKRGYLDPTWGGMEVLRTRTSVWDGEGKALEWSSMVRGAITGQSACLAGEMELGV